MDVLETEVVMLRSALEAANARAATLESELKKARAEIQRLEEKVESVALDAIRDYDERNTP